MEISNSSSYESVQQNEIDALAAIFGDSFELLPKKRANRFKLTLVPHPGEPEENYSVVTFQVTLPPDYPREAPNVIVEKEKGISEAELAELRAEISAKIKELVGREIIYELTQYAEEWLQRHNHKPLSFYDEMIARQVEKEKQQHQSYLQEIAKEKEEEEALQEMIRSERKRKEEMLRATKLKKSIESSGTMTSSGDWPGELSSHDSSALNSSVEISSAHPSGAKRTRGRLANVDEEEDDDDMDEEDYYDEDDAFDSEDESNFRLEEKLGSKQKRGGSGGSGRKASKAKAPNNNGGGGKVLIKNLEQVLADVKRSPSPVPPSAAAAPATGTATNTTPPTPAKGNPLATQTTLLAPSPQKATLPTSPGGPKQPKPHFAWTMSRLLCEQEHWKVFKGFNFELSQSVIVKEIPIPEVPTPELFEEHEELVNEIQSQICRASKEIDKHDHVVHYIDCDLIDKKLYIFSEFVAGGSIQSVLQEAGRLDETNIKRYTKQILRAMSFLHSKNFTNINVHVSNMMLDNVGNVKLCDYAASEEISDLINGIYRKNVDYLLSDGEKGKDLKRKQTDIKNLGQALLDMAYGPRDTKPHTNFPDSFSKEARAFVELCLKTKTSVVELLKHPFVTEENSTFNQEEPFIPMTPPSSMGSGAMEYHQSVYLMTKTAQQQQLIKNQMTFGPGGDSSTFRSGSNSDETVGSGMYNSGNFADPARKSVPLPPSRYRADFEELEVLGKGGFGQVVKARNRLDGRVYAIKKIRFARTDSPFVQKMLREVTTLSRLHHQHVVRYYHSWIDDADEEDRKAIEGTADDEDDETFGDLIDSKVDLSDEDGEDDEADWFGQASLSSRIGVKYAEESSESEDDSSDDDSFGADYESPEDDEDNQDNSDDDWGDGFSESDSDENLGFDFDRDANPAKRALAHQTKLGKKKDKKSAKLAAAGDKGGGKGNKKGGQGGKQAKKYHGPAKILYIQMEYCTERTLRTVIDEKHDEDTMWKLFRQIVEGLNHIHSQGIIHRDLKPSNIFIDHLGDAKIGDFGLAVTSAATQRTTAVPSLASTISLKESLTIGVGTPFYLAPEQEKIGSHYDQKVDMYSLGVIFFEMFHKFGTGMERVEVLKSVRENPPKFPPQFEKQEAAKAEIVKWLMDHDPSKRPTTSELLQSDLLPARLEEEILKEALRTIAIPNTTMFNIMMKRLFSIQPDDHVQFTYDYGIEAASGTSSIVRAEVSKKMAKIFQKHGAISFETPLFMPKPRVADHPNVVDVLDETGTLLQTPYDLTMPFARWIAHSTINNMRRYQFGNVYRRNIAGGQPRELCECDFDIVAPQSYKYVNVIEVIKTCAEALNEFGAELGPVTIRINHYRVLDTVIASISPIEETQNKIRRALSQFWKKGWTEVRKELATIEGLQVRVIDSVIRELVQLSSGRGLKMKEALSRLAHMFPSNKTLRETIKELKSLNHYAKVFGIVDLILFDITLVYNYEYYYGDVVFQLSVNRTDIISAGGCYDSLIDYFASPVAPRGRRSNPVAGSRERRAHMGLAGPSGRSATGVNIALDRIVALIIQARTTSSHMAKNRLTSGMAVRKSLTQAMIYSQGANLVDERVSVAIKLWSAGLRAEYMYEEGISLDELLARCKSNGIPYLIILRDKAFQATQTLKIKNVETKAEDVVPLADLPAIMSQLVRQTLRHPSTGSASSSQGSASPGSLSAPLTRRAAGPSAAGSTLNTVAALGGGAALVNNAGDSENMTSRDRDAHRSERDRNASHHHHHHHVGHPPSDPTALLDVEIISGKTDRSLESKAKRKVAYNAQTKVAPLMKIFHSQQAIKVGAMDLPLALMREISEVFLQGGADLSALVAKNARSREKIYQLRDFLVHQKSKGVFVLFLYSTSEDDYCLVTLRK